MHPVGSAACSLMFLGVGLWAEAATPPQARAPEIAKSVTASGSNVSTPPTCPAEFNDSLQTDGIVGKDTDGVNRPKPKFQPAAEFSDQARKEIRKKHIKDFNAVSVVSFVLDESGRPKNPCLKEAAGLGLDEQAAKALMQYKFDPATKDGKPVPMRLTVEISFRIF